MINIYKLVFLSSLILFAFVKGYSQQSTTQPQKNDPEKIKSQRTIEFSDSWKLFQSVEGVDIYYKYVDCKPSIGFEKEQVILKFINTEKKIKILSWHIAIDYGYKCLTCDFANEYSYELRLRENESIEGSCELDCPPSLKIFSKFKDTRYKGTAKPMTYFELMNLKVDHK